MTIRGIHHITLVCADAQRTADFYTGLLGLQLVKQTVNFDQPTTYHLYFGGPTGAPGTLVTFFEWPDSPKGHPGIGGTHHFALIVESTNAQLKWKRYLEGRSVAVDGPYDRGYFYSIYFRDPDGCRLEIATRWPGMLADEDPDTLGTTVQLPAPELTRLGRDAAAIRAQTWPEPVAQVGDDMRLAGLHHISAVCSDIKRTAAFYTEVLGLQVVKRTVNYDDVSVPHWYFGLDEGAPGTLITYFAYPVRAWRPARIGQGQTHHFAFCVDNEAAQLEWRARLEKAGLAVTPVLDRKYFRSIYFRDPDGHILEIATRDPGFLVDEPAGALGQQLALPPWLEAAAAAIRAGLHPLHVPPPGTGGRPAPTGDGTARNPE